MKVIIDILQCFALATIPAGASYFLSYCLGIPSGAEVNSKSILFFYTRYISEKRLIKENRIRSLIGSFANMLNSEDPETRRQGKEQLDVAIVMTAAPLLTWERAFGMCLYCTNFWFCVIASVIFFFSVPLGYFSPLSYFLLIPVFSHSFLRNL